MQRSKGLLPLWIQNRRYLGNKFKLHDQLRAIVKGECGNIQSFCDIFAGTGVVGYTFNCPECRVIVNDLLFSNYVPLFAWFSPQPFRKEKVFQLLCYLNSINTTEKNYVSENFGNRYFTYENASFIGRVREEIEALEASEGLNFKEKSILLTSLLYAVDKAANTCGHYDAYRRNMDVVAKPELRMPIIKEENNQKNEVYCSDANLLIKSLFCDVLYLDPPYNSRQYSDTYHLLENLMRWEKPPVFGVARKMDRKGIKSEYCLKRAPQALNDLISSADCRHILVSYNNTADKGNVRSNARISDEDILESLSKRGSPKYYKFQYPFFTAGKNCFPGHEERIFYVKVTKG